MKRFLAAVALACLLAACVRTSGGEPFPTAGFDATGAKTSSGTTAPNPGAGLSHPGVVPTTRIPLPVNAATCPELHRFPVTVRAKVTDPAAPIITIGFPDGWSMTSRPRGDVGAQMEAKNGMWATVTIAKTELGPAQAFGKYVDDAMAAAPVSSVGVLPADLCGYSGQKLIGAWSDTLESAVEFADRLLHIWTDHNSYLVAVHVQAPTGTAGFDAASYALMQDFAIVIP
jgi:hypothetical protein